MTAVSTSLAPVNNAVAQANSFADRLAEMGNSRPIYVSHSGKTGNWKGSGDEQIEVSFQLIVNPRELVHSYLCWVDGKPVSQYHYHTDTPGAPAKNVDLNKVLPYMGNSRDGVYIKRAHGKDGWSKQWTVPGFDTSHDREVVYRTGSESSVRATEDLIGEMGKQMRTKPAGMFPVVEFTKSSYKSKTNGEIYVPAFKIVSWVKVDDPAKTFRFTTPDQVLGAALIDGEVETTDELPVQVSKQATPPSMQSTMKPKPRTATSASEA
jgi:hypothetical protein